MGLLSQDQPIASSVISESSSVQSAFLSKVYGLLLLGLLSAVAGVYMTLTNVMVQGMVMGHPIICTIAYFALFFACSGARRVPGLNILALLAFTFFTGAFILGISVFLVAAKTGSLAIVYEAATITGSIFTGLSLYTMISKRDFSFMGGFLNVAIWSIIGLSLVIMVVGMFHVDIQAANLALAWIGAVVFSLFILYNTSNVMRMTQSDEYVLAALMLYLNVINLFLFILQILSNRRN